MKLFIKHKVVRLLLLLPLLMAGCQANNGRSTDDGTAFSADSKNGATTVAQAPTSEMRLMTERGVVLERVKTIFSVVKAEYMKCGGIVRNDMFDRNYCSKSWNKLLLAVRGKEERTNTLFFEIDYWALAREPGFVTFDDFEVTALAIDPQKFASVTFTVYDAESYTPGRVDLVYEDGRWVIDNFYDFKYMLDVRQSLHHYLDTDII